MLQLVVSNLTNIFPGIEKTPGSVWWRRLYCRRSLVIDQFPKPGSTDGQLLDAYPSLSREDLKNAWSYYSANQAEIDELIAENEDF